MYLISGTMIAGVVEMEIHRRLKISRLNDYEFESRHLHQN
ncbi:hypothetical protein LACDD01_02258 [Lactococcus sp. DD01]|nr:hypothetical protein LACDD01_02258 [Lactococcus sp. DD01]